VWVLIFTLIEKKMLLEAAENISFGSLPPNGYFFFLDKKGSKKSRIKS
jgi:hypothetical protein